MSRWRDPQLQVSENYIWGFGIFPWESRRITIGAYLTIMRDECVPAINDWYPDQKGIAVSFPSYPLGNETFPWEVRRTSIQHIIVIRHTGTERVCSFSKASSVFGVSLRTVGFATGYILIRDSISFDIIFDFFWHTRNFLLRWGFICYLFLKQYQHHCMSSFHQLFGSLCQHYHHLLVQDFNL